MSQTKTLAAREAEVRALMGTVQGKARLEEIADGYRDGRRPRPPGTSVITYILAREREKG